MPRQVYVIYLNPRHAGLWEEDGTFRVIHQEANCKIYATDWHFIKKDHEHEPVEVNEDVPQSQA